MKTVLFAWELGGNLGHVMNLRRIGARLKSHGVRLVAALKEPSAAAYLQNSFDTIVAAPPWRRNDPSVNGGRNGSSATLNDMMSDIGLADRDTVRRILSSWDEILRKERPDLMIADFAPLAGLAARDRIPVVRIGNGYTLPPHEMKRFPLLHRLMQPEWDEDQTLSSVNAALDAFGWRPLEYLPQLFSGDACLVQTFPLLDPYDTQRTQALDGPILNSRRYLAPLDRKAYSSIYRLILQKQTSSWHSSRSHEICASMPLELNLHN